MYNKDNVTPVMVYLPNQIVKVVDRDRGNFSRSGYLATLAEIYLEEMENYEQNENAPQM